MLRTTVVGSYPKVTETGQDNLPGVIDRWQKKAVGDEALEQELKKVVQRVIREQEETGIDLITDGQIPWEDLVHSVVRCVQGIRRGTLKRFFDNNVYYRKLELDGQVQWTKSCVAEEFQFVSGIAKRAVKAVVPGPVTLLRATEPKEGFSEDRLLSLYEGILRREVETLAARGAKEIQLDEPSYCSGEPLLEKGIEAVNRIFDGVKARRWVACYFHDASSILPALSKLKVEVLGLDLVTAPQLAERLKGGLWKGEVALGLVDARNTKLESKEELKIAIGAIAKAIPIDRLWLSPNCGLEFLPHSSVLKKLQLLREAASD